MPIDHAGLRSIRALKKALTQLPITASARIAARYAPVATQLARDAHASGRTAYGAARPLGVDGKALTLDRTGDTKRALSFVATGRDVRLTQLPRYAKYLIGKYDLLPNGPLPTAWRERIREIAAHVLHEEIHRGGGT